MEGIYNRIELLLGEHVMNSIKQKRVIVFGVGGVGSWCAESLLRSGFVNLTIVDSDRVCVSNINRQLLATTATVGQVKVEVLKKRLLEINPSANICALQKIYSSESADDFQLDTYDYIVDAIDSLSNKADLIMRACRTKAKLFSSMGAALKVDPTAVQVAEFWKVKGCPLGAALRRLFKRKKMFPSKKFTCVFSEELLENKGEVKPESFGAASEDPTAVAGDPALATHDWNALKARINGTTSHIVAIFGFTIAGLIMQDVMNKVQIELKGKS